MIAAGIAVGIAVTTSGAAFAAAGPAPAGLLNVNGSVVAYYWQPGTDFGNSFTYSSPVAPDGHSCGTLTMLHVGLHDSAAVYNGPLEWASPDGGPNDDLRFQSDGNLVLYNSSGRAVWASNTHLEGYNGEILALQSDGNLVIYVANQSGLGPALWASNTYHSC